MMNDAPEQIWAWVYDEWKTAWDIDDEESPPHAVRDIRADHAQAEKEAAVAAEREACAEDVWHECYPSTNGDIIKEIQLAEAATTELAIKAIRARANTDALERVRQEAKAEALRDAAVNLRTYAPHLEDGPEHDVGYYHGYQTALNRILALIPADQEDNK